MKVALMADPNDIGNDEPWNSNIRRIGSRANTSQQRSQNRKKMTLSAPSIAVSADFTASRALRWIFATAVLAAIAAPGTADAARFARVGAYDGTWNVRFATQAGNCSSNSVPFNVSGRHVSSAGGGQAPGALGRAG